MTRLNIKKISMFLNLKTIWLIFFLIIFFSIIYINRSYISTKYANIFVVNNAKKGSDIILILSGGVLTRAPHAFSLIEQGYSKRIMITKMLWHKLPYNVKYPSDTEMAKIIKKSFRITQELEVLPSSKEKGASSTFDEAKDFKEYIKNNDIKSVILVTDEHHSRRALLAFNKSQFFN